jgi:serine/threonine protein kinase
VTALPPTGAFPSSDGPGPLPRAFGRYVLFDRIGHGGMADIFLARADTGLGGSRLCVVKQILPSLSRDPAFERMLVAEAKLAAGLSHANIVQVFDLGREGDRLYIAMEYVEGFDLNQLLRALSQGRIGFASEFAIYVVRELLRALDYAHRLRDAEGRPLGIVHRDVSPSNVLISFEGEVRLCDFGIARALNAADQHVGEAAARHKIVGKSAYMSPEHAQGGIVDARSDVFAAGILLWELCAGRRLYRGSEQDMLELAKRGEVHPLPTERGLVAQEVLQRVLDRALATDPGQRFQSAHAFLEALEDYAATARQVVSQLRFGAFLTEHFGAKIMEVRRERENAVRHVPSQLPEPSPTRTPGSERVSRPSTPPPAHQARPSTFPPASLPSSEFKLPSREWRLAGLGKAPGDDAAKSSARQAGPAPLRDSSALNSTSVTLDTLPQLRVWSEPGLDDLPASLGLVERALADEGGVEEAMRALEPELTPRELEQSLSGISNLEGPALDQQRPSYVGPPSEAAARSAASPVSAAIPAFVEPSAPVESVAPPATVEREWLWYLAALAILALGLAGYFWR